MDVEPEPAASSSSAAATTAAAAAAAAIQAMMVQITTDGVPKLHCPVCNKALVSLNGYVKHVKKHDPPGGFLCRYCSARYCSEDELKRHREEVHTTIACRLCKAAEPITFTNEIDYREHIRAVHDGIDREMFKCDKCGAEYKTIDPYKRHMDTECGTIKPHKCDQCPMAFVTKYNLKQHKEVHSGERKFCCSYCGKNFLQKGRLVEHERSHTGEKPYKCDVCGKCFAHRESIVTHSSIHTGIRLVECKCCLSRFSCYSNLIKHRRTRQDTCGLPEFDPPKNRVRTHRSRIPPTLNPTSEIKVSSMNKIIKPLDQEHFKKTTIKKETAAAAAAAAAAAGGDKIIKPTARKRTGPGPRGGRKAATTTSSTKRKRKPQTESESEAEMTSAESDNDFGEEEFIDEVTTTTPVRKTRRSLATATTTAAEAATTTQNGSATVESPATTSSSTLAEIVALKVERKPIWSEDSEESEDYPDFDPADESESDEDRKDFKIPLPMAAAVTATIKQDPDAVSDDLDSSGFEYSDGLVDAEFKLKSEDENNIFNDKDKLLDCLLNSNDDDDNDAFSSCGNSAAATSKLLPSFQSVKMEESNMLMEAEVMLIKDENDSSISEEDDVLDVRDISDSELTKCEILLEDVTVRYPKLKEETSIKVGRNAAPFFRLSKQRQRVMQRGDRPPRKYRKRGEPKSPDPNGPKRMAKISQQELKARLKMLKKEEKSWPCPHCIKIYHMRKPYEKHLRDDHKRPEEEIRKIFKTDEVGVINEEIFKCQICDKIYLVEKRLIAHVKLHGPEGTLTFKCPCFCNLYFTTKEEATAHAQTAHRKLLFCEICQKFMTGHDSLKNHIKNHHPPEELEKEPRCGAKRNLVCDKCGKKFSGRTSLTDHVRSDCGKRPLYACSICGKHLTTAGILKTHMLLHKDDTPYQCDVCGKTFKVKAQYKTHIKTRHTDYKPFQCHLCPKAYPYRESLLTHMTVHTGIKRFLCNGCGKRFTCISNLQAHRKVHADTCGALPLNAKATQYMGVQKGNLLLGAKPEAGLEYQETNTLIARDVLDRDMPMAQEINTPPPYLATVPLNYSHSHAHSPPQIAPVPMTTTGPTAAVPPPHLLLPQMMISRFIDDSTHSQHSTHSSHSYN